MQTSSNKTIDLVTRQVEKTEKQLIADFQRWEGELNPTTRPPIRLNAEQGAASLRKFAATSIKKAIALLRNGKAPTGHDGTDFHRLIDGAARANAQAWLHDWERDRPQREEAARREREARRTHSEHVQALRINVDRIAELHDIIKQGLSAERLLANLYRAYEAQQAAEAARRELLDMRTRTEAAAAALGTKAPNIEVPEPIDGADEMAEVFLRALHSAQSYMRQ